MNKARTSSHNNGSIQQMLAIALPMVVSQACDTAMIFTGRVFLSRLEPELMNAAMGGGLTVFMMMSFFIGLTGYSSALVAQYLGAGRKKECAVVITQAALFCVLAYLPILASRPLGHKMFEFMGISPEQLGPQNLYFDILLFAVIISLLRNVLSCFFSGIGRTRVVMVASFTSMIVNALLGYIFIFGKFGMPALGIRGAAYAAILGGLSGLLILITAYLKKKNRDEFSILDSFRFNRTVMSKLLRFGSPAGLEFFLNILAFNALVMIFHAHGLVTATAATIMFNWDMVSFVPLLGIEIAVTSMVGRFMGAGDPDSAHRSVMSGLKLGIVYTTIIFAFFIGIPQHLVEIFHPSVGSDVFREALPLAIFMIRLASLYVLVEAVLVVFIGALRGAGDTFWAMCISVSLHWLTVIVLLVVFRIFNLSPQAAWAFMVGIFFLFSVPVYLRYRSGKWRAMKVVEDISPTGITDGFHEPIDL
ncbi:MAG: MATE family efflux transporter [Candidatus Omnitrophica bacterium]|nr:MATE family efflux transporter [Candidatus Omnitrophota bacterium]